MTKEEREHIEVLLSAYLDGELDAEETSRVKRALREDADARRLLEELRQTARLIATAPRHAAPPSILEDVRSHVERGELLGDFDDRRAATPGWRLPMTALLSVAAMITLVVVSVWYVRNGGGGGTGPSTDVVVVAPEDREMEEIRESLAKEETFDEGPTVTSRLDADVSTGPPASTKGKKRGRRDKKGPRTSTRGRAGETPLPAEQPPKRPAMALSQFSEVNLLATASVDQKLVTSVRVSELRQHPFVNETLRLQIVADDRAQRDAVAAELVSRLARSRIADLAEQDGDVPARTLVSDGFYYQGRPGVNFERADESQILVRVSAREFNALLDEVERLPIAGDRVVLYSGPFGVRGLDHARRLLGDTALTPARNEMDERGIRIARRGQDEREVSVGTTSGARYRGGEGKGPMSDLLESVGVDLDTFAAKPDAVAQGTAAEEPADLERSTSVRPEPAFRGDERSVTTATEADLSKSPPPLAPQFADAGKGKKGVGPPWAREDATEVTPGEQKDEAAVRVTTAEPRRVRDTTATPPETPTLVDRRLKELVEPPQAAGAGLEPRKPPRGMLQQDDVYGSFERRPLEAAAGTPSADKYFTVVVRLTVERPEPATSLETESRPESATRAKSRPSPKPHPKSTPQK